MNKSKTKKHQKILTSINEKNGCNFFITNAEEGKYEFLLRNDYEETFFTKSQQTKEIKNLASHRFEIDSFSRIANFEWHDENLTPIKINIRKNAWPFEDKLKEPRVVRTKDNDDFEMMMQKEDVFEPFIMEEYIPNTGTHQMIVISPSTSSDETKNPYFHSRILLDEQKKLIAQIKYFQDGSVEIYAARNNPCKIAYRIVPDNKDSFKIHKLPDYNFDTFDKLPDYFFTANGIDKESFGKEFLITATEMSNSVIFPIGLNISHRKSPELVYCFEILPENYRNLNNPNKGVLSKIFDKVKRLLNKFSRVKKLLNKIKNFFSIIKNFFIPGNDIISERKRPLLYNYKEKMAEKEKNSNAYWKERIINDGAWTWKTIH